MANYGRLSNILNRQRRYRIFDSLVAVVFAAGIAVTTVAAVMQIPSAADAPQAIDAPASMDATSYTAQLLADAPDQP